MQYRRLKQSRPPDTYETAVVERLLAKPFPGRDDLLGQFHHSRVRLVADYGAKTHVRQIYFEAADAQRGAEGNMVPVRGTGVDDDDVPIDFVLHVKPEGVLEGLDNDKADASPINRLPAPESIEVWVRAA
jgi:hypothetical protein